jgi:hypothetical protein
VQCVKIVVKNGVKEREERIRESLFLSVYQVKYSSWKVGEIEIDGEKQM